MEHKATSDNDLLSAGQVAERLAVSRVTVYRMIAAGEFPRPLKVSRMSRWRRGDVENWIENLEPVQSVSQEECTA